LALAAARPDTLYEGRHSSEEVAHVVRDDRVNPSADGQFSYDFETSNGIRTSKSGSAGGSQGSISFTLPNGEAFELTFVADGEGYKPVSSHLPVAPVETRVAPVALHPIPQHALDQIEKAAREDAAGIRYEESSSEEQSRYYN